jgi:hypothetical protein
MKNPRPGGPGFGEILIISVGNLFKGFLGMLESKGLPHSPVLKITGS